jgi:uncharacterized cupin superfamily protein
MAEASLEDGVPVTAGWFVVNAREVPWLHNRLRSVCHFGGKDEAHFDDLGVSLYSLQPGQAMSLYHHEARQEDFLVLAGSCTLIIDGQERPLRAWDLVHSPPNTPHTIVATENEPALVLAVGAQKGKDPAFYPADPVAIARGAGVPEGSSAHDAYASFGAPTRGPAPDVF